MTARRFRLSPARVLTLGFLSVVLLGAVLLSLPVAANDPAHPVDFFDAMFTSTSAVCVTGLTVVNTGLTFSLFGKIVLLFLIQVGGLGFMTVAAVLFMAIGKHISLKERLILQESLSSDSLSGLSNLVRQAITVTFITEAIGAALLCIRLIPLHDIGNGIFYSVFLSVSAFCNAGFDPFGFDCSIVPYGQDALIGIVLMALVVIGGIGFAVVIELLRPKKKNGLSLHTRIVVVVSAVLLILGTGVFLLTEWNNPQTLGAEGLSFGDKLLMAAFQSVTVRTAGFDAIGQGALTSASVLFGMILMFIGASPASTGGGIKTTTLFVAIATVWAVVRQREDYTVGKRRLSTQQARKALAILLMALAVVLVDTFLICVIQSAVSEPLPLPDVLYEVVSACATVGLSTGITASLAPISRLLLIVTMFMGRVGLLTVTVALSGDPHKNNALRYPEERILVG